LSASKFWRRHTERGYFQTLAMTTAQPIRVVFPHITGRGPGSDILVLDRNEQPVDIGNIDNYVLNTATINPNDVRDQMQNQILNVHRRLDVLPFPTAVQVGGARRVQERDRRTRQERWT